MKGNIFVKAAIVGFLALLLLIPIAAIKGTIEGREKYAGRQLADEIKAWGGRNTIAAPVINVPYTVKIKDNSRSTKDNEVFFTETKYTKFTPQNLKVTAEMKPQIIKKGIFKTVAFVTSINMKGNFAPVNMSEYKTADFKGALLSIEMPSLKGINVAPVVTWEGKKHEFSPSGIKSFEIYANRNYNTKSRYYDDYSYSNNLKVLTADIDFNNTSSAFEIAMELKGAGPLGFAPLAKNNTFEVSSSWPKPLFTGGFLPEKRDISKDGFNAVWNITSLSSGIAENIKEYNITDSLLFTELEYKDDIYAAAQEAATYGLLLILVAVLAIFVFEAVSGVRIHIVQYLLTGLAISIFYLLVVAMAEFSTFACAYLASGLIVIALISVYARASFAKESKKAVGFIAGTLVVLYGYTYILMQLKDYAFIFGALGLFVLLAGIMYVTRNIKWYGEK
ncbi:inner membrane protein [Parelusimicrobium proximum]|uniref:cell envelope integrity protein CreD n=1 Tax=Parelusimicrobium proximum TaxID=3228953 RepID=UPI003D162E39